MAEVDSSSIGVVVTLLLRSSAGVDTGDGDGSRSALGATGVCGVVTC